MAFVGKVYKAFGDVPLGKGTFQSHRPVSHDPAGARFGVRKRVTGYGSLAAPTLVGRRGGPGVTPAIGGLFRRGPAIAISQINAMATNVLQGSD